jgi:plastocyanin
MRKSLKAFVVFWLTLGVTVMWVNTGSAADTHVIKSTPQFTWTSNGKSSKTDGTPLIVDDLRIGDVVEFQIAGVVPHGVITIKQVANQPPASNETRDPVLACGEDKSAKPNAVLREIECGNASQFGVPFKGSMKLEVLDTFKEDTSFWCVVHRFGMTGKLKLKP